MNHISFRFAVLLLSLVFIGGCSQLSGDEKIRKILADVQTLQDEEEILLKELMSRENIWLGDRLDRFPENRGELEPIAQNQIKTLSQIIELEETQIEKLRSIRSATLDRDFSAYTDLQAQAFEKRLESHKLGLQRFSFISDLAITSRTNLEQKVAEGKASQDQIDIDIAKLEQRMAEHRKRIGK